MAEQTHEVSGYAGQPITLPTLSSLEWSKDNYVFLGWGKTRDATILDAGDGGTVIYEDNTDLYAIWAPTDYFYLRAQDAGAQFRLYYATNLQYELKLEYSLDCKQTWTTYSNNDLIKLTNAGDTCYIRAINKNTCMAKGNDSNNYSRFTITSGRISIGGNIMSLLDKTMLQTSVPEYCFANLFSGCTQLVSIADLKLPAIILNSYCYAYMFSDCTNLTDMLSELPATTLANDCYCYMFSGCSKITDTMAELPATSLAVSCYYSMFSGCSSLTGVMESLPATNIYNSSYYAMFSNCMKLETCPTISATIVDTSGMSYMFDTANIKNTYIKLNMSKDNIGTNGLNSLFKNYAENLSIEVDWTDTFYHTQWLASNKSLNSGTFICTQELKDLFDDGTMTRGDSTVPSKWTIVAK